MDESKRVSGADLQGLAAALRIAVKHRANPTWAVIQEAADALTEISERRAIPEREAVIEECARVARDAAGEFMSNSDRYVMQGPSGLVLSMIAAIRALSQGEKP